MPEPFEYGWRKGHKTLYVGHLPGRKSPAIYVHDKTEIRVLGYARSESDAEELYQVLWNLIDAEEENA